MFKRPHAAGPLRIVETPTQLVDLYPTLLEGKRQPVVTPATAPAMAYRDIHILLYRLAEQDRKLDAIHEQAVITNRRVSSRISRRVQQRHGVLQVGRVEALGEPSARGVPARRTVIASLQNISSAREPSLPLHGGRRAATPRRGRYPLPVALADCVVPSFLLEKIADGGNCDRGLFLHQPMAGVRDLEQPPF
jgi:hypothetical protein